MAWDSSTGRAQRLPSDSLQSHHEHVEIGNSSTLAFPYASALRWFFLALSALIVVQSLLNYAINPLGAFGTRGYLRYDIRSSEAYLKSSWLNQFAARNQGTPVAVALGSSRMMALPSAAVGSGVQYFNAGIPGAKGEDILAFSRYLVDRRDLDLKQVIIGIDPAVFRTVTTGDYGLRVEGVNVLETKLDDRVSRSSRMRSTISSFLGTDWAVAVQDKVLGRSVRTRDFDRATGVRLDSYFARSRNRSPESRSRALDRHIDRVVDDAQELGWNAQRESDVRESVRILSEHGVKVTLVLMPFNPTLLDRLMSIDDYVDRFNDTKQLMLELAESGTGVTACDLSDPSGTALSTDEMWWDGYHYTAEAGEVIASEIQACVANGDRRMTATLTNAALTSIGRHTGQPS